MESERVGLELIYQDRMRVPKTNIHYNMSAARLAFSPCSFYVAWKGKFPTPKAIIFQESGESYSEFVQRADKYFVEAK
jgi:hypothetical protein